MSNVKKWLEDNPNGVKFKCSCGATVNLKVWTEEFNKGFEVVHMHARCWKCNKELDQYKETMLIDLAIFDMMDAIINKFQEDFNRDAKPKAIRVVKK